MRVIGITGGVGSGKSEVLNYIKEAYSAVICQLDEVAKMLEQKGQPCFVEIVKEFGPEVIGAGGELNRKRISELVFGNPEKLQRLNGIVHPAVKEWVRKDIALRQAEGAHLYVIEAALLPEAGYGDICREMWYIYAREDVRRARLKASRGYSEERITRMIGSQSSEQVFRAACQIVIDNSGDFEDTKRQIGEWL